jgi:transposase
VIAARERFGRRMLRWPFRRLVFVDESGVNLSQTCTHAWAPRGERIAEQIPGRRETYSIIAALRSTGIIAPMVIPGAMNTDALLTWIEEVLGPHLHRGDIVIWDNVGFHNAPEVAKAVRKRGARVEFTPPYSPELNPIEEAWSKMKSILRVAKARAAAALVVALDEALSAISPVDCTGWFRHAGYATT